MKLTHKLPISLFGLELYFLSALNNPAKAWLVGASPSETGIFFAFIFGIYALIPNAIIALIIAIVLSIKNKNNTKYHLFWYFVGKLLFWFLILGIATPFLIFLIFAIIGSIT